VIQSKSIVRKKSGGLLAAALLAGSFMPSFAGETMHISGEQAVVQKAPPGNPLSFLDGVLTFDVQERLRWEIRDNNFDFNDDVNVFTDDNWLLQRFRIGLLIKPTPWLRIYAQGQDSREINSDRADFPGLLGAEGDDSFDLRQGYIEIGDPKLFPLTLKVGRQLLSYGDERLVGAFDWNNIGRTFDAVKLRWEEKLWSVDAFASTVVVPTRGQYNQSDLFNGNETGREQFFAGVYFSTTALPFQSTDVYGFYLSENTGQPLFQPNALDDTGFFTLGFRMKSKPGAFAPQPMVEADGKEIADAKSGPAPLPPKKPVGLDYTLEAAFQTGEVRGLDLTAFAAHLDVGYTFDAAWRPRIALGYSFASGDSDPLDGDIETFQNLFPTNHKFYGQMDLFAWQNLHDLELNFKVAPVKAVTIRADFHAFFLASTDDVWYRANGVTAVRPLNTASRNADSYAGSEIDLLVTWAVNKNVALEAGYSHFFAGDYLSDTGPSDDADFGYVQATITF
jgi:hypothetical protein